MAVEKFPDTGARLALPRPFAYPSDYGLATATSNLLRDYGRVGAVNRLIEMAQRIEAGGDPLRWALMRRRVEPDYTATPTP